MIIIKEIFLCITFLFLNMSIAVSLAKSVPLPSHDIPWKIFFNEISGNISNYQVAIPEGYVSYSLKDFGAEGTLWGTTEDIKKISGGTEELDIQASRHPVFRVRWTRNVTAINGILMDNNGPLDEAFYLNQGMKNLQFKSGFYHGIKGVPAVSISGTMQGSKVYMLYLYNPVDNLTVLVNLQGGNDKKESVEVWNIFVDSIQIKK